MEKKQCWSIISAFILFSKEGCNLYFASKDPDSVKEVYSSSSRLSEALSKFLFGLWLLLHSMSPYKDLRKPEKWRSNREVTGPNN